MQNSTCENQIIGFGTILPLLIILIFAQVSCKPPVKRVNTRDIYDITLDSVNQLYDKGQHQRAITYLDSVSQKQPKLSLAQKAEYYSIHYNYSLHVLKSNSAALHYADSMLNLFTTPASKQQHSNYYSQACFYKGDALFLENNYNEAYFYFYQGKLVNSQDSSLHNCVISDYSYRMGMTLYRQEHYRQAAQYFITSFNESEYCPITFKSFYREQELLNNTGLSYSKVNELDSAELYYNKALRFIDSHENQFPEAQKLLDVARGVVYGNLATIYMKQQMLSRAKIFLQKSIAINSQKGNDNNDAALSELKLANVYLKQLLPDSAYTLLSHTRHRLDSLKNDNAEMDWFYLMATYYEQKNDLENAIAFLKQYDHKKDNNNKKASVIKETDVAEQLKRFERDYELSRLKATNRQKNIFLIAEAAVVIMALLIILLIFQYWRKSKSSVSTLCRLNQQINNQNTILENTLNELKLSSQEKDRILRTVAHDLRNPIGGISSLANILLEDDGYTEDQKSCLSIIKTTAQNSLELINEILEATNNKTSDLNKQPVDINFLLNNSVELLKFKAAEKNQKIMLETLGYPVELLVNKEKIWRVVSNLLSNAIKFSPVGESITIKITEKDTDIQISVKDNGIGIPDDLKPHVFNMFTEAKRAGTLGEKPFGLGLSISRQIIENHDGEIWFESAPGKGSTFYIKLPKNAAMSPTAE